MCRPTTDKAGSDGRWLWLVAPEGIVFDILLIYRKGRQRPAGGIDGIALSAIVDGKPKDALDDARSSSVIKNVLHILRLRLWADSLAAGNRHSRPANLSDPNRHLRKSVLAGFCVKRLPHLIKGWHPTARASRIAASHVIVEVQKIHIFPVASLKEILDNCRIVRKIGLIRSIH